MTAMTYPVRRPSTSQHVEIRGLRYHVRRWGWPEATPLVMLHGWMDVSASFQFVVDTFARERAVLAPDWRGFGLTDNGPGDCYWFPDYLADLDLLLDALVGDAPVILVGHSMGGNVAMMYAGIRPARVRAVVNLEGFGLRDNPPERAPARFAQWMDVSASFQFVVDAFARERAVLAPDWRGFGFTDNGPGDCYWFPDYLADLDLLLDALVGDAPVILVGHSMGGNVAMMYAGIRPARVRAVVNLEGFGLRDNPPERAPARFAQWMDEIKSPPGLRDYASLAEVAARLRRTNARLSSSQAEFLAPHWSLPVEQESGETRWRVAGDPAHRLVNPVLYRWAEVQACWQQIAAPLLWVEGGATDAHKWAGDAAEVERRLALLPNVNRAVVEEAGHMLHHDQPQAVAQLIEGFVDALPPP